MILRLGKYNTFRNITKCFSTSPWNNYKVCVVGCSGSIGQSLSLLLKLNSMVSQLCLYDLSKNTPGVALDVAHINRPPAVYSFVGPENLPCALYGAHVVVIPAGVPRKPGMSRDDLFNSNANLIYELACAIGLYCPCALVAIITNPVNSMVPIAAEVLMRMGVFDPCRLFGVTTLDLVRASTFVAQYMCIDPAVVNVPVVGGHAGKTIIPLLSRTVPIACFKDVSDINILTVNVQDAGTEVVKAKAGAGSASLSMAFAAERFVNALLKGLAGQCSIECAYVKSCVTSVDYFANPLILGRCGIERNLGVGFVSECEQIQINEALAILKTDIEKGVSYVAKKCSEGKNDKNN